MLFMGSQVTTDLGTQIYLHIVCGELSWSNDLFKIEMNNNNNNDFFFLKYFCIIY